MLVRQLNRSKPLRLWFVLGMGLAGATLSGPLACNSILGNEVGHRALNGGSGGTAASAGADTSSAGSALGGGSASAGAPSAGASSAGAPSAGAPSAGAPSAGAPSAGAPGGGASGGGSVGNAGASGAAGAGGGTVSPYCPGTITECGGNLVGTWVAQSSCLILPSTDPTIPSECQMADAYQRYKVTGNVTYTATTWVEDYVQDTLETLTYSGSCITAFHNKQSTFPAPASASTCGTIASNLKLNGASSASCPFLNNGCNCALTFTASGTSGDSYAKVTNSEYINNKDATGHPVSYCVQTLNGVTTLTTSQTTDAGYTFQHVLTSSSR
jgi:hypothetical protein